jgi:hypothetical protein
VAGEVLMSISKDERERAIFRSRRIAQADRESDMATMKRIEAKTIAEKMINNGEPIEKIVLYTGLTHAEVKTLQR